MSDASSEPKEAPSTPPAKKERLPWGPVAAVLVTVLAFFGAQYLALLIVGALFSAGSGKDWLDQTAGQFYFVTVSDLLILSAVWLFIKRRGSTIRRLGFLRRPAWADVGLAIAGYLVYLGLLIAALTLLGIFTPVNLNQKQELGFNGLLSHGDQIMAFVSLVVMPPIVEEIVFRGFVFGGMRRRLGFRGATIATSLLFANPHLLASSQGLLWVAGVDTFVLSLVLCYLREKTGALWAPMAVHALKNSVAFILLITATAVIY